MFIGSSIWCASVIVVSIHVRHFIAISPIGARCVRHRLVVATSFFEEEAHVLLANDANVKDDGRLKEVCDYVNVEKEIVFEPRENKENPRDAHCYEHQNEHNEAGKFREF